MIPHMTGHKTMAQIITLVPDDAALWDIAQ